MTEPVTEPIVDVTSTTAPVVAPEPSDVPPEHRGALDIGERVIERIAAHVANEVDGVGSVPTSGIRRLLTRGDDVPTADASLAADTVAIELALSVDYPLPIRRVTEEVRGRVVAEVERLTGLHVEALDITVPTLLPEQLRPARPRVQ